MRLMNPSLWIIALLLFPVQATAARKPHAGDTYRLERISDSSEQRDGGMTGSSYDRDALIERVIAVRDTGTELEYDLPDPTPRNRDITWQFPARVFRPFDGPPQLLNAADVQTLADRWLRRAKLDRAACGHWTFTWTAIRIECDPQSAIRIANAFDFGVSDLRDGALYLNADARAPASLTRKGSQSGSTTFAVDLAIDPDKIRQARAEGDLVIAEMLHKPLSRDDAIRAHSSEDISGTISVTFETDPDGQPWRRTTVTKTVIKGTDGKVETRTTTETLTRRLVSQRKS